MMDGWFLRAAERSGAVEERWLEVGSDGLPAREPVNGSSIAW